MDINTEKTYNINRSVDALEHIETVKAIFDFLANQEVDWPEDKIFIDGEYDSNQTEFERASNQGEIGVLSNNDNVGHCLLFFLRMIIDKNYSFFFAVFEVVSNDSESETDAVNNIEIMDESVKRPEEEEINEPAPGVTTEYDNEEYDRTDFNLTMEEIFKVLKKQERAYTTVFGKNDKINLDLYGPGGRNTINKIASEIDLWDLSRIRNEVLRLLEI